MQNKKSMSSNRRASTDASKRFNKAAITFGLSMIAVGIWQLSSEGGAGDRSVNLDQSKIHSVSELSQPERGLPSDVSVVRSVTADPSPDEVDSRAGTPDDFGQNFFTGVEAKARLTQVANQFEADIKYPHFSKPILHTEELDKYIPNKSLAAGVSLKPGDETSLRVSIQASKHRYFAGETIMANIYVENAQTDVVSYSGRLVAAGKTYMQFQSRDVDLSEMPMTLRFNPSSSAEKLPDQLRIIASVQSGSDQLELGTPVEYLSPVARLKSVSDSYVEGAYLAVPVEVETSQPGFHEVSGILFSAVTGQPLVSVSQQAELLSEIGTVLLNAHIASLKAVGEEGPYELRHVTLSRMPSRPNFQTEYGLVAAESFPVQGYSFSVYDDVPYEDPEAQARLEFLKQIAQN